MPTVHIAVYDTYADWELGYLTAHLNNGLHQREPGAFRIRTVGPGARPVTSMGGLRVLPDLAITELDPADSALLVLPGAEHEQWATGRLDAFVAAAGRFLGAGVPVAAICGATFGLARAGLLDDRAHTSNDPSYLELSGYAGAARYVAEPAVSDGDLITASGVAPVHFARAVFARLDAYRSDVLDSWFTLYGDRDPAGYYALMAAG